MAHAFVGCEYPHTRDRLRDAPDARIPNMLEKNKNDIVRHPRAVAPESSTFDHVMPSCTRARDAYPTLFTVISQGNSSRAVLIHSRCHTIDAERYRLGICQEGLLLYCRTDLGPGRVVWVKLKAEVLDYFGRCHVNSIDTVTTSRSPFLQRWHVHP